MILKTIDLFASEIKDAGENLNKLKKSFKV